MKQINKTVPPDRNGGNIVAVPVRAWNLYLQRSHIPRQPRRRRDQFTQCSSLLFCCRRSRRLSTKKDSDVANRIKHKSSQACGLGTRTYQVRRNDNCVTRAGLPELRVLNMPFGTAGRRRVVRVIEHVEEINVEAQRNLLVRLADLNNDASMNH